MPIIFNGSDISDAVIFDKEYERVVFNDSLVWESAFEINVTTNQTNWRLSENTSGWNGSKPIIIRVSANILATAARSSMEIDVANATVRLEVLTGGIYGAGASGRGCWLPTSNACDGEGGWYNAGNPFPAVWVSALGTALTVANYGSIYGGGGGGNGGGWYRFGNGTNCLKAAGGSGGGGIGSSYSGVIADDNRSNLYTNISAGDVNTNTPALVGTVPPNGGAGGGDGSAGTRGGTITAYSNSWAATGTNGGKGGGWGQGVVSGSGGRARSGYAVGRVSGAIAPVIEVTGDMLGGVGVDGRALAWILEWDEEFGAYSLTMDGASPEDRLIEQSLPVLSKSRMTLSERLEDFVV